MFNTCCTVPTIVRLKSFIIIAEQATNKVNNSLRLVVRCRLINDWRIVNDYHLFIAHNPIYFKSHLTIKFLCLIHTFKWAIKLHLLTESFIVENTKKKNHAHIPLMFANEFIFYNVPKSSHRQIQAHYSAKVILDICYIFFVDFKIFSFIVRCNWHTYGFTFVILCKLSLFSFIHVFMNLYLILYSILKGHLIIRKKTPIITRNIPRIYISTFTFLLLETLLVNNFFQV